MSIQRGHGKCVSCPRRCGADRSVRVGACGAGSLPYIARAALHMWEEPCISGKNGSGAIFFCGCNLRCVFCQNHDISRAEKGVRVDVQGLCAARAVRIHRVADRFAHAEDAGAVVERTVDPHGVVQRGFAVKRQLRQIRLERKRQGRARRLPDGSYIEQHRFTSN